MWAICFLAAAIALASSGHPNLLLLSFPARAEAPQGKPSRDEAMHRHYDEAFRLQEAGRTAEADVEHKLFLAEALHRVANGRANIGEYALAVPVYEEAMQFAPKDFTVHLEYAEAALDADDPAKARLLAQEALSLIPASSDPRRAKVMHVLAQAFWGTGERKQSIEAYKAAAAIDPNFDNIYAIGATDLSLADKESAARVFAGILTKFGDTAAVRMRLGRAYALASDYPEAIQEFRKALARDNKLLGLHYSLGAAMMQASGEAAYPEAEAEFRKELAIQPNDRFSYPQLARIALARHDYKVAESNLARANELDPDNPDTSLLAAQLYTEMGRNSEAIAALKSAIAATPDPARHHYEIARAHYQLGRLLSQSGDTAAAKEQMQISADLSAQSRLHDESTLGGKPTVQAPLQKTHVTSPEDVAEEKHFEAQIGPVIASSYDNLGVHAAIGKDYAVAAAHFGRAAEWNPTLAGIDNNWGQAAFEAHDYGAAVGPLSRTLQTRPQDAELRSMLGLSQYMLHDYQDALETLRPVRDQLDMFPLLPLAYADSMMRVGDFHQGLERLEAIVQADPRNPMVHRALAEAYRKNGQPQDAEREDRLSDGSQKSRTVTSGNSAVTDQSMVKN